MSHRHWILPVLALGLLLTSCKKEPPPAPEPEPVEQGPTGPDPDSLAAERARLDSIRAAEEARRRALEGARATLEEMVFFEFDQSRITPEAEAVLRRKVDVLRASPTVELRLAGHADERGSTEYNLALGSRRAESVRRFLAGFGLEADRFTTVSYGEEQPLVRRSDEEAWAQNRRVEFVITAGANEINPPRMSP
jgi:peptidoglycan-associated lipoprotein